MSPLCLQDFTIPIDILKNKRNKTLHSIITYESNNREQFIHCWDGDDFFELTSLEYPADIIERSCSIGKCLEGMQITGRSMRSVFFLILSHLNCLILHDLLFFLRIRFVSLWWRIWYRVGEI